MVRSCFKKEKTRTNSTKQDWVHTLLYVLLHIIVKETSSVYKQEIPLHTVFFLFLFFFFVPLCCLFCDKVLSQNLDWPRTTCIIQADFKFVAILLPHPPKCWVYRGCISSLVPNPRFYYYLFHMGCSAKLIFPYSSAVWHWAEIWTRCTWCSTGPKVAYLLG